MPSDTKSRLVVTRAEHDCDECTEPIDVGAEAVTRYRSSDPDPGKRWLRPAGYEYYHPKCWDEHRAWLFGDLTTEKMRTGAGGR